MKTIPGSMWHANRSLVLVDNLDVVNSPLHEVPKGSIILVLAGPFLPADRQHHGVSYPDHDQARFWFLVDGRPFYDVMIEEFLEPVTQTRKRS